MPEEHQASLPVRLAAWGLLGDAFWPDDPVLRNVQAQDPEKIERGPARVQGYPREHESPEGLITVVYIRRECMGHKTACRGLKVQ